MTGWHERLWIRVVARRWIVSENFILVVNLLPHGRCKLFRSHKKVQTHGILNEKTNTTNFDSDFDKHTTRHSTSHDFTVLFCLFISREGCVMLRYEAKFLKSENIYYE